MSWFDTNAPQSGVPSNPSGGQISAPTGAGTYEEFPGANDGIQWRQNPDGSWSSSGGFSGRGAGTLPAGQNPWGEGPRPDGGSRGGGATGRDMTSGIRQGDEPTDVVHPTGPEWPWSPSNPGGRGGPNGSSQDGPIIPGKGGYPTPAPPGPPGAPPTTAPTTGDPMDPAFIRSQVLAYAQQHQHDPGFDPSLLNDPDYWVRQIQGTGGWTDKNAKGENNIGYWTDKFATARGGGSVGGFGSTQRAGNPFDTWGGEFHAPTGAEVEATPGYQFALKEGLGGVERSAAAKGTLLTGGTLKALNNYASGFASTNYQQSYQNAMSEYLTKYNIFDKDNSNLYNRTSDQQKIGLDAVKTGSSVSKPS